MGKARTPEIYTVNSLAKRAGMSRNAIYKRSAKLSLRAGGLMKVPGVGYFVIRKSGGRLEFVAMKLDEAAQAGAVQDQLVAILRQLKDYACADCAENIEMMISNVKKEK